MLSIWSRARLICEATQAVGAEPPLTLKVYFESDAAGLYAPIPLQLERIQEDRLPDFKFDELDLQLSCKIQGRHISRIEIFRGLQTTSENFRAQYPKARLLN